MPGRRTHLIEFEQRRQSLVDGSRRQGERLVHTTDHQVDDLVAGEVGQPARLQHRGAVAQHRHGVADREDLFELVAHEQHGTIGVLELGHHPEQALGLVRRDRGRRLVEQQHPALHGQRLRDLDQLGLRDRELRDGQIGIEVEVELGKPAPCLLANPAAIDQTATRRELLQQDVLADAEAGDEVAFLVYDADPGRGRLVRRREVHLLPVEHQPAAIRPVQPGDDLDQRRLAGAVLPEQGVHRSRLELQRGPVQRPYAGEDLLHPGRFEQTHATPPVTATSGALTTWVRAWRRVRT